MADHHTFRSRFLLQLDSPAAPLQPHQIHILQLDDAIKHYPPCQKRQSLGSGGMWKFEEDEVMGRGELWTTETGRLVVIPGGLNFLLEALKVACCLGYREARLLYPDSGKVDLSGLFDFLLLETPLKVVVEADSENVEEAHLRLQEFESRYRPPLIALPPRASGWVARLFQSKPKPDPKVEKEIEELARVLLHYHSDRDPSRLWRALHVLRHLNHDEVCCKVLEIHREFYEHGRFETHKTYPRAGDEDRVAGYLSRLYEWARSPAWMKARNQCRVRGVPAPWQPHEIELELLDGPPPLPPSPPELGGQLRYEDFLAPYDSPRLEAVLKGGQQERDYLLSNADYGETSALAAVAAQPEAFGTAGAAALLKACSSCNQIARKLARQWTEQDGHAQLKLDAYFELREDQARLVPSICCLGADAASQALYRFLTEKTASLDQEALVQKVGRHLSFALEHRLQLRADRLSPGWLPKPAQPARGLHVEKIVGREVLALTNSAAVLWDNLNRTIVVWRKGRGQATFATPQEWFGGVAYSLRDNILVAVESDHSEGSVLQLTGLPSDIKPRSIVFAFQATSMLLCPQEEWLAAWGEETWAVYRWGSFTQPVFLESQRLTSLAFAPDGRHVAVSHDHGVSLHQTETGRRVGRWEGFYADHLVWGAGFLVARGEKETVTLATPELQELGRLKVKEPTILPHALLVSHNSIQVRHELPSLQVAQTYQLVGKRSWLTPDHRVLVVATEDGYNTTLRCHDAGTLREFSAAPPVPVQIDSLQMAPGGDFATAPGYLFMGLNGG